MTQRLLAVTGPMDPDPLCLLVDPRSQSRGVAFAQRPRTGFSVFGHHRDVVLVGVADWSRGGLSCGERTGVGGGAKLVRLLGGQIAMVIVIGGFASDVRVVFIELHGARNSGSGPRKSAASYKSDLHDWARLLGDPRLVGTGRASHHHHHRKRQPHRSSPYFLESLPTMCPTSWLFSLQMYSMISVFVCKGKCPYNVKGRV